MDREIFRRGDDSGRSIRFGLRVMVQDGKQTNLKGTFENRTLGRSKRVGHTGAGHSDMRFGTIDKVLMDNHCDLSGSFNLSAKRC
jgi:hypothetical protein